MTMDDSNQTFYDLLELSPDASPQEVRAAYLRAKSAYKKDSVALYTLLEEDETEALLERIEVAYLVLSNPEKRREYDRQYGMLSVDPPSQESGTQRKANVVSIDRVPPMDRGTDQNLLVPPTTDFVPDSRRAMPTANTPFDVTDPGYDDVPITHSAVAQATAPHYDNRPRSFVAEMPRQNNPVANSVLAEEIQREVSQEMEWRGAFLRKVREAKRMSIEELADYTKISKTYLRAIEDESYDKLPAPVYLRGFVTQFSKALKLPHEQVVSAYMIRFNEATKEKGAK